MKKKFRRKRYVLAAILIIGISWIFRPYESPDKSQVIPELAELQEPLQVETLMWADGGSLGIQIEDRDGKSVKLCLPNEFGEEENENEQLFVGSLHYSKTNAVEVENPHHSMLRLLEILRDVERKDMDRDRIIASTSGRWRDWAVFHYRRFRDDQYYDW